MTVFKPLADSVTFQQGQASDAQQLAALVVNELGDAVDKAPSQNAVQEGLAAKADSTSLADTSGASLIGFLQAGTGATLRTVLDKSRETVHARDFHAIGDGVADDTTALQTAINYLNSIGGGTLDLGHGTYLTMSLLIPGKNIAIVGQGSILYGFNTDSGGATLKLHPSATTTAIIGCYVTAGGTGYTSAPIVVFTGGGGTGASATANISAGSVTGFTMISCGTGYTSAPTISFTGGSGTGATAVALPCAPIFYGTGSTVTDQMNFTLQNVNLHGGTNINSAGVVMSYAYAFSFFNVHTYNFQMSAFIRFAGACGQWLFGRVFGVQRQGMSPGAASLRLGTIDESGTDINLGFLEIGAASSGDSTNLPNSSLRIRAQSGGGQFVNLICEGADVGLSCEGSNNMFTNVRCDINYGHGFWINRSDLGTSPPTDNKFWGVFGHRNSHYTTNTYDNFHIDTAAASNQIVGYNSNSSAGDSWKHRYGVYDGGNNTIIEPFFDRGALTAKFGQASTSNAGPQQPKTPLTVLVAATSMNVSGLREARISNGASAISISALTGGFHGDELEIQTTAANITLTHGGTSTNAMYLSGTRSRILPVFSIVRLKNIAGVWFEVCPWAKQAAITVPTLTSPNANETALLTALNSVISTFTALGLTS